MEPEHAPLANNVSFAFVATRGPGYLGDIAIDDVDVSNKPCSDDRGENRISYSPRTSTEFRFPTSVIAEPINQSPMANSVRMENMVAVRNGSMRHPEK